MSTEVQLPSAGQSDLLCSIVLVADQDLEGMRRIVAEVAAFLGARFRFWEIVVITRDRVRQRAPDALAEIAGLANVRTIVVRDGVDRYHMIPVAAAQSIGDVVIFVAHDEFGWVDLDAAWQAAERSGQSVFLRGKPVSAIERGAAGLLSQLIGFPAEPDLLRSCVHFRDRITTLLRRTDSDLAFRFPSRWSGARGGADVTLKVRRDTGHTAARPSRIRRAFVVADLLAHAAPRLLKLVAVASLVGLAGSAAFGLYAIAAWLLKAHLAPGWLTTSLAISGSTAFLCAALGCVALGIARLLDIMQAHATDDILDQTSNTDQFDSFDAVNVLSTRT